MPKKSRHSDRKLRVNPQLLPLTQLIHFAAVKTLEPIYMHSRSAGEDSYEETIVSKACCSEIHTRFDRGPFTINVYDGETGQHTG